MASFVLFKHPCVLLIMLLLFLGASNAQRYRNMSSGSSLTPLGRNTSWLSPSGEFAFGFYPLPTNSSVFLLAIWFVKISSKTIVWYANGDNPVEAGSKVVLTTDGRFSLEDSTGSEVWNAGITNASYAAMLDTGNFMLVDSQGSPRWQSFRAPSDTMLPSQVLDLGSQLSAHLMDDDYSSGRFTLRVQIDGNLVLYTVAAPSAFQYDAYWATSTVGNGSQLVFKESGIYFDQRDNTTVAISSSGVQSTQDFYQRATLDADGVFRHYIHPRNGSTVGVWSDGWTSVAFQPPDICQVTNSVAGSGACGFNSYCRFDEDQHVDCECPPQYSFLDADRKYRGCKPDFAAQSCEADASETQELYEFTVMTNVDWPSSDYEQYGSIDEEQCREECLADCFCAVATYGDGNCNKKRLPLSIGRTGSYGNKKVLIKVPKGNRSESVPPCPIRQNKGKRSWILPGSLLLGAAVFVLLAAILVVTYCTCSRRPRELQPASSLSALGLRPFTYDELREASDGFSEELGRGGSSVVYKGFLQDAARTCVAIKKLDKVFPETQKEFMNEVETIARTYHKNLVRLLGFCYEGAERLLVYEYMSKGSLMGFLFADGGRPEWNRRIPIALGIARGLQYLHEECFSQVIHCDIKPQNILLDDNFTARISDFGLAKLLRTDQTRTKTDIRGTKGYVAPEWFKNAGITTKVDVYGFGVVLLEIVCCRRNVRPEAQSEEESVLAYWVNDCFRDGRLELVVEGDDQAISDMKRVERLVKVALWCIQEDPSLRPTMQKVTQMLDGSTAVPVPPDPSSYISSIQ
ncbi:G-type lectin S-receptor-like serine threonine-protein kinase [Musa troglodytarum]|uniref:Receptor-like serine/threonine-protein kinase n=1 Tax=Musa troglodytarum TaxID=320322 RepID=A0A9E7H3X9_9LILI|nr:G-type lectin S-receptor-like serine threonine-protein kinase [Musa troglodytarum]